MNLQGQHVLVTGGVRRVGRAIGEVLAQAGAKLTLHCHGSDAGQAAAAAKACGNALVARADLRDPAAIAAMCRDIAEQAGRIDVLVNCAASFSAMPIASLTADHIDDVFSLNVRAPLLLAKEVAPAMAEAGAGVIVNILDVAAYVPWRNYAAHCAAKAALAMATASLALELAPTIRAVGVAPGSVLFPEQMSEQERAKLTRKIPLGRPGTPKDVAEAVRFLIEQDYLTGTVINVDGGRMVGIPGAPPG